MGKKAKALPSKVKKMKKFIKQNGNTNNTVKNPK